MKIYGKFQNHLSAASVRRVRSCVGACSIGRLRAARARLAASAGTPPLHARASRRCGAIQWPDYHKGIARTENFA